MATVMIGCAGWSIPREAGGRFPGAGSHLRRYAAVLLAGEIDSSFSREHRPGTYERWASEVPPSFRFSVKLPAEITHARRLARAREPLERTRLQRTHPQRASAGDVVTRDEREIPAVR